MDENRNSWYSSGEAGWYSSPHKAAQTRAKAPEKKPRTGMKIAMVSVFVLVLVAATALAFSQGQSPAVTHPAVDPAPVATDPAADPGDYADFRDFFENYYTPAEDDTIKESSIPRAENGTGVELSLVSSDGKAELSLGELYDECIDSVVGIIGTADSISGYYWGTGIVMTSDGYVLTNAHVISGTEDVSVVLNSGEEYEARLVGEDTQTDIAVLKIEAAGLKAAEFGDSSELSVGDRVAAIGNPLGSEFSGTMTDGIVSAIDRGMSYNGHTMTLIQTNAALNEGNSGGPLFNMYGQVVGITNMKMVSGAFESSIEGIGFAIPTSRAKRIVDELIETGAVAHPGIGITAGSVPQSAAEQYGLPEGVYISEVRESSDAYRQGIRPGDVLVRVNGIDVQSVSEVNAIKDNFLVGDQLELELYRDGGYFTVTVTLGDMDKLQ